MSGLLLLSAFALFLILQAPIGIAIGLAVLCHIAVYDVVNLRFLAQTMFSSVDTFPLMAIPFFILAGAFMEGGGLSRRLIDFVKSLVGATPGGLGIVTVLACAFFGAISGSSPATVAAIGSIMIPFMVAEGYDIKFATALTACSGGLGVIIPPSIPMVVYSVATDASVGKLFIGGFGPGFAVTFCLVLIARYIAKKNNYGGTGEPATLKNVLRAMNAAKWALMVPVIILGGIYGGVFTPTEAAVVAVLYGLFVGLFVYRELKFSQIPKHLIAAAQMTGMILIIVGTATSLGRIMTIEKIPDMIAQSFLALSDNKFVILLIINVFLLFVGMIMDTLAAILILAPILLNVVVKFGVDPVHFGLIMILNLAIGFVTPPVGVNLFVASGMTGVEFLTLSKACLPFIAGLLVALAFVTVFPALTLWLPTFMGM
jgi:C4-dicarboxylate transporter DctM subunit